MKKRTISRLALGILGLILLIGVIPLIGLHYPRVVENEPLHEPLKVFGVQGTAITLEDGRTLDLDWIDTNTISNRLSQSDFYIDLADAGDGAYYVHARQDGWVCGTPWAQPIRVPLFADTVYRNKRRFIARGKLINSQPGAPPNPDSAPLHRDR